MLKILLEAMNSIRVLSKNLYPIVYIHYQGICEGLSIIIVALLEAVPQLPAADRCCLRVP